MHRDPALPINSTFLSPCGFTNTADGRTQSRPRQYPQHNRELDSVAGRRSPVPFKRTYYTTRAAVFYLKTTSDLYRSLSGSYFPFFALALVLWNMLLRRLARGYLANRRHPATRTFGTTSGRTTLVQLSSHELHSHPSSSPLCGPRGSRTCLNEFRRFSSMGVFGNPFRSVCDYQPPHMGISIIRTLTNKAKHELPQVDRRAQERSGI